MTGIGPACGSGGGIVTNSWFGFSGTGEEES